MAQQFRKKPVIIETIQWTGFNLTEIINFVGFDYSVTPGDELMIKTLEGELHASRNDWIIKGIRGEFYPCKPDIFESYYERIS
jgi:hypothetical protein